MRWKRLALADQGRSSLTRRTGAAWGVGEDRRYAALATIGLDDGRIGGGHFSL